MKNIFILVGFSILIIMGCGEKTKQESDTSIAEKSTETSISTVSTGETLIANNDCLGCHQVDQKIVGPSYKEIATKYRNEKNIDQELVRSIIEGSVGKFGEIPMSPHPAISKEDASKMVEYILTLQ